MVPNLPGFYYDRERRRYFRISENRSIPTPGTTSQYSKDNIKRQSVQARYDKELFIIKRKRQQTLQKYKISLLNPLERAFRPLPYEKYIIGLGMQYAFHSHSEGHNSHRSITTKSLNVPNIMQIGVLANYILLVTQEGSYQNKLAFATSKGYIVGFSSLDNCSEENFFIGFSMAEFNPVLKYKSEPTDLFKTMKLERTIAAKEGPSHYFYHNINSRSNVHTFAIFMQDPSSLKLLKVRQVKLKENCQVHDSLVVGDTLIVTVNDCCHFYDFVPETFPNPYVFFPGRSSRKSKKRSDITSLSFRLQGDALLPPKKSNSAVFYIGYRNGDSMAMTFSNITNMTLLQCLRTNDMTLKRQNQPIRSFLKSIVSIKALNNKGLIIMSGMAEKEDVQQLIIADTFLEDTLAEKPVISFKTKFLNVTKDTEIFEVSDDGRYFIYGSTSARNGKGDFEVFCTVLSGNLGYEKSEGGNITLYPIRVMKDYCRLENPQSEFIHLHSAFMPSMHVKMRGTVGTLCRQNDTSPHDISEEVLSQKVCCLIRREDSPYNGANVLVTSALV
ncbi:uncharacterized protein SPAR_G00770 [Saccharomyces paradoxus]|uniref:Uncharacterized protein n=1 Tax=Saccharomyces paradoxus TaxID=27291 RepID=A0A8B8UR25_SACPA|nr:uncharacterized protein SPAR_G00770 [Saccharomyces paradoxus]QHS73167.1 hypothetical protein SPAR_G00770 [Saccharomyces paradoxus]